VYDAVSLLVQRLAAHVFESRAKREVLQPDKVAPAEVGKLVKVTVKPLAEINYLTLHNNLCVPKT
jgi:hypothetical protein